jgi:hypothetical protein
MIVFDLFEQDPNFRKPVEYETRKQFGTVNLANFIKAYERNQPVQFDFPGGKSYKLTKQWVDMLADYYNTLETNNDKAQLVYDVLTDYNKTIRLLNELSQSKLFEKKSSKKSDNPEFKSTKLARLKTQARAKYPAASSDLEAMAADFVDSQDADQQEFQRVKATNKKQDELLKQIVAINQQQDQEIDGLDSDNNNLQQNLQQLRAVNTELAKKLADMAKRKPKEKEKTTATTSATSTSTAPTTAGGWVPPSAADTRPDWTTAAPALPQAGIPTATPAMVGGEPATVLAKPKRKRRTKAEIDAEKASKAAMAVMTKAAGGAKIIPIQRNIPATPTVGQATSVPDTISVADTEKSQTSQPSTSNVIDMISNVPDKLERLAAESINEANTIPVKSVIQGYTVDYSPDTGCVTVSRGGRIIGSGTNTAGNPKYHSTLINRIIDSAEDDKYPVDIDDRDVALPMKKAQPMKVKELQESGPETWTVYFTDGTKTRVRVPNDETNPTQVKAYFAKKGKTVDRFDYTSAEPNTGSKPEPHEPGSGTAVSARTGERLPEADTFNRGGNNKLRDKNDYFDKREYLAKQLDTPGYSYADRQAIRDRMMQLEKAARMQGFVK